MNPEFHKIVLDLYCLQSNNRGGYMAGKDTHMVDCACGKIQLEVSGSPIQVWCHCSSCAKFHQSTPVAFSMLAADNVKVRHGLEYVQRCSLRRPELGRFFCTVSADSLSGM